MSAKLVSRHQQTYTSLSIASFCRRSQYESYICVTNMSNGASCAPHLYVYIVWPTRVCDAVWWLAHCEQPHFGATSSTLAAKPYDDDVCASRSMQPRLLVVRPYIYWRPNDAPIINTNEKPQQVSLISNAPAVSPVWCDTYMLQFGVLVAKPRLHSGMCTAKADGDFYVCKHLCFTINYYCALGLCWNTRNAASVDNHINISKRIIYYNKIFAPCCWTPIIGVACLDYVM